MGSRNRLSSSERGYGWRWQKASKAYLRANPFAVDWFKRHGGRVYAAEVVDHIIPHRGDRARSRTFWVEKKGLKVKTGPEMPSDLDREAKKKWAELVGSCDVDVDGEMLANYCRQYSSLLSIRREKARQQKAGTFKTMVRGRDRAMQLNPLQTAENRLIASLNRMLRTLGLMPAQDQRGRRKPASDADEIDPLQAGLCWPYGFQKIRIWREIRRGKVEEPTSAAERAELEADRVEADRRLAEWKSSVGIFDDGEGPIRAPCLGATREEWHEYHQLHVEQRNKTEAALRRAGLDWLTVRQR
jgi:phage terminase small subunit